jgi:hypothetical protein
MKICPGVEDGYILGSLYYRFVSLFRAARIHFSCSCASGYSVVLLELRRLAEEFNKT